MDFSYLFRSETSVVNMFKVHVQYTDLVVLLSVMQPQVFREITNLHILSFTYLKYLYSLQLCQYIQTYIYKKHLKFYYNTLLCVFIFFKNLSN